MVGPLKNIFFAASLTLSYPPYSLSPCEVMLPGPISLFHQGCPAREQMVTKCLKAGFEPGKPRESLFNELDPGDLEVPFQYEVLPGPLRPPILYAKVDLAPFI